MTTIGFREQNEREVLASFLLTPSTFGELPERFDENVFELSEHQKLFKIINHEMLHSNGNLAIDDLKTRYPDMKDVIVGVLYGAAPLNGRFRSCASQLMNHKPIPQHYIGGEQNNHINEDTCIKKQTQLKLLTGKDLAMMEVPKQKFLIDKLITTESIVFLAGEEGCGKSILASNLALSIAIGAPKWLCYDNPSSGKVIYLNNELSFYDFARRFQQMSAFSPARGDISQFIAPENVPPLAECWDSLYSTCQEIHPSLLVLDAFYFCHARKENDSSEMKELMRQFILLRDTFHIAILIIHHTKKGVRFEKMHDDQMRGSSVFSGVADTVLQIRRSDNDESKRLLKPTKFRHVSDDNRKCHLLSLNPSTLWFKDEGETDESEHISTIFNPPARERLDFQNLFSGRNEMLYGEIVEAAKPFTYSSKTVQRCIEDAVLKGILLKPKHGRYQLARLNIEPTPDTG